jgi:hypothetical protein
MSSLGDDEVDSPADRLVGPPAGEAGRGRIPERDDTVGVVDDERVGARAQQLGEGSVVEGVSSEGTIEQVGESGRLATLVGRVAAHRRPRRPRSESVPAVLLRLVSSSATRRRSRHSALRGS